MFVETTPMLADATSFAITAASDAAGPALLVGAGAFFVNNGEGEDREEATEEDSGEVDFYRDTWVRYFGYTNELGEAFGPLVPGYFVPASYAVAIIYVLLDTVDKTQKALNSGAYKRSVSVCAAIESANAFVWQILASVAFPGYTIHQVVKIVEAIITTTGLDQDPSLSLVATWAPTITGLAAIPFIIKPLDELAEVVMDATLRKWAAGFLDECSVE